MIKDGLSSVQFNFVALPVEFEIGEDGLLGHRGRNIHTPNTSLAEFPSHNEPLDPATAHIDNRPDLVALLRLHIHVLLLVLFTNRPIISVVANAVHLLETELLVLALLSDDPYNDVVVLYQDYSHVEVEFTSFWQGLVTVELVSWAVQLLDVVC